MINGNNKADDLFILFKSIQALTQSFYSIEETYDNGIETFTLFAPIGNYVFKFTLEEVGKFLNLEKVTSYSNIGNVLNERVEYEDYSHDDRYFNQVLLIKNLLSLSMEAQKEWKDQMDLDD